MKRSGQKWMFWFFFLLIAAFPGMALAQEGLPPKGKPLNLEQCVDLALKYQPLLQASQASIAAQKARVEQALAAYYPQVNFNSTYNTSTTNFSTVGGDRCEAEGNSWSFTIFFLWGRP